MTDISRLNSGFWRYNTPHGRAGHFWPRCERVFARICGQSARAKSSEADDGANSPRHGAPLPLSTYGINSSAPPHAGAGGARSSAMGRKVS